MLLNYGIFLSVILFALPSFVYAQDDIMDKYCQENWQNRPDLCRSYFPEGYFDDTKVAEKTFTESDQEKLERLQTFGFDKVDCPVGYHEKAISGEGIVCVNDQTGQRLDTQAVDFEDYIMPIIIGVIIIVIIVGIAVGSAKKTGEYEERHIPRRGWTPTEQEKIRIRQNGRCDICKNPPNKWTYHHRDGNRDNNALSNCQGLCYNCHADLTY